MIDINPNLDSHQIKIFLCVPQQFVKTVKINANSSIGSLMQNDEYKYIFNGNIVRSDLNFNDIGTTNGNLFVAFKNGQEHVISDNQWIKLSNDSSFESKLHSLASKRTKTEYFRLRDIRNMKIEGSLKLYRKMSHKLYMKQLKKDEDQVNFDFNINYEPPSEPCEDEMPILW